MRNKAPPKKRGGAQAKCPSSHQSVVPPKPRKPADATKARDLKQKTRQLVKRNEHVLKEFCWVAYHDLLFVARGAVWITIKYHDEIIQIALLLFVMYLQYRIHAASLLHH
jgi:hypothetical protein